MPRTCVITGSFAKDGHPIAGVVRFTPYRMWVMEAGVPWACLAPEVKLDEHGVFNVRVTATDSDAVPWQYLVETPAGFFKIDVPWIETGYSLKGLIGEHHSGPRPEDRR